jgi:hypothetical protein
MLDLLPITRQAVSKHLAVLERAELVERRRELLYRVNVEQFDRATRSLSDLADVWDKRLARIKGSPRRSRRAGGLELVVGLCPATTDAAHHRGVALVVADPDGEHVVRIQDTRQEQQDDRCHGRPEQRRHIATRCKKFHTS